MAILTNGPVIRQGQVLEEFQTPFSDYLGAKFREGLDSNPVNLLMDNAEFNDKNGVAAPIDISGLAIGGAPVPQVKPRVTAEEVQQRAKDAGVKVDVPEGGLSSEALDMLIERRKRQKILDDQVNRSPTGMRSAAGFGASLAAGLLDPLNIGLAFVPVVGEARYATMLAKAATPIGRAGVRAGVGAAEGAVGIAALEPFTFQMHQTLQDDYSAMDSLMNIAFGSVLGGGLHVVGGAFKDHLGKWWEPEIPPAAREDMPAPIPHTQAEVPTLTEVYGRKGVIVDEPRIATEPHPFSAEGVTERVTPQTREAALRTAVGQAEAGRVVDVEPVVKSDASWSKPTESPQFKQWFSDSKVVDDLGQPLVVYHGTRADFDGFDVNRGGGRFGDGGVYFTNDSNYASGFAEVGGTSGANVIPAYINLKNPYIAKSDYGTPSLPELKKQGYDGIVYEFIGKDGNPVTEYVAFDPKQIKSAVGNSGRFDPNSGSLTDQIASSAARQSSPESIRVADVKASEAADERLSAAPKSDALSDAEAELGRVMADLQNTYMPIETADGVFKELKVYDDAIKSSEELGRAARAAAICDLRG